MSPRRYRFALLFLILLIPAVAAGQSGIPDPSMCTFATRATAPVSVLACPESFGDPLTSASLYGGGSMDATIEGIVRNADGEPIAGVPHEDIWLHITGVKICGYFVSADFNTTETGYTRFSGFLRGGGSHDTPGIQVMINGESSPDLAIPWIRCNSPDLNADGRVNLNDAMHYSMILADGYDYAADFAWDGQLNVADVGILAQHVGHACP